MQEKITMSFNNYTFKLTVSITEDKVDVCILCIGECSLPLNTCLLSIQLERKKRHVTMTDFYHTALHDGKGASGVSPKLKGAIYAVLCLLLSESLQKGMVKQNDQIVVLTKKEQLDNPMVEHFYEKIGFTYDPTIQRFRGSVQQVYGVCQANAANISQELISVLNSFFY